MARSPHARALLLDQEAEGFVHHVSNILFQTLTSLSVMAGFTQMPYHDVTSVGEPTLLTVTSFFSDSVIIKKC